MIRRSLVCRSFVRRSLACLALAAVLASCSTAHAPVPTDTAPQCPAPKPDDAKDGGIGGTGKTPEACDEAALPQ
jgi:hypothetical protein